MSRVSRASRVSWLRGEGFRVSRVGLRVVEGLAPPMLESLLGGGEGRQHL